jgi:prevent-host-death family protein
MCVMGHAEGPEETRVGVRELRQNLSVYLARVKEGQSLDVTEHGRRVARLVPASDEDHRLDRLIAEHRATPGKGSLADLGEPSPVPGKSASEALREMREEERW